MRNDAVQPSPPFPGACSCGAVRYQLVSEPLIVHACHCGNCQRQSGGAYAINAVVERERVEVSEGELSSFRVATPSGAGQTILRCTKCMTALWSHYHAFGELAEHLSFLKVGTLDNPSALPPDVHIHTATRLPHVELTGNVPAFEEYYSMRKLWRPESQERLAALRVAKGV